MPYPVGGGGSVIKDVCETIYDIEMNPQTLPPGPAINNLPAVRGPSTGHMDDHEGAGGKHHHRD